VYFPVFVCVSLGLTALFVIKVSIARIRRR